MLKRPKGYCVILQPDHWKLLQAAEFMMPVCECGSNGYGPSSLCVHNIWTSKQKDPMPLIKTLPATPSGLEHVGIVTFGSPSPGQRC